MEIPQEPLLNYEEVLQLLPHAPPMVMIDKLWFSEGNNTVSGFSVKEDNIFCKDNFFTGTCLDRKCSSNGSHSDGL